MALDLLERLRQRLLLAAGALPTTIPGWVDWILDWLIADAEARRDLLGDSSRAVNGATGRRKEDVLDAAAIEALKESMRGWLQGEPLNVIEGQLGGAPDSTNPLLRILPRARELVGSVIPRGLSFIAGVVARMTQELGLPEQQADLSETMLASLSGAVRRGFDTVAKMDFANANRALASRVAVHRAYQQSIDDLLAGMDDL